jgi:hypothetical protein
LTSNFLVFDPNQTNLLDDAAYTASTARQSGVEEGIAESTLYNKAMFQCSSMVAAFAEFLSDQGQTVVDANYSALVASITAVLTPPQEATGVGKDFWLGASYVPAGWVLAWGTIGNASSNATNRANADTQALFVGLWNSSTNTALPLYNSSGSPVSRGASALADWAANCSIALPDKRGRASVGLDNMGGTAANRITNASVGGNNSTTLAGAGGAQTHTLVTGELPTHTHGMGSNNTVGGGGPSTSVGDYEVGYAVFLGNSFPTGSDQPHSNTQPWIACNYIIKL